jgi:hypothetical protein
VVTGQIYPTLLAQLAIFWYVHAPLVTLVHFYANIGQIMGKQNLSQTHPDVPQTQIHSRKLRVTYQAYKCIGTAESILPAIMSSLTVFFPLTSCSPLHVLQKFFRCNMEKTD